MPSRGWTHREVWKPNNRLTGIAVGMNPIPPATLGILQARLTYCVTRSSLWIQYLQRRQFNDVRDLFVKYFRCDGMSDADCQKIMQSL